MKFLHQLFVISAVLANYDEDVEARIYHDKHEHRSNLYKKYRCHSDLDDTAWGIKANENVYVDFFHNKDCSGHWKRRAWGRTTFKDSIDYCSIRLSRREKGDREGSSDESDSDYKNHDD
ncbi:hypothetical protein CONCODRAFT_12192 [Conidiobolus coronatus NRRL 28638]|uniref:Uncharacterized protein n=1 Tax=Conidiobolus coronatus (strain ATCC 28846 / CBS 209.66 / NRRL 28638) TaxID=796925 RepID=A0A137NTD7_CONC2|nr:hypothetical protein CONCODRAFT_12192 [Conidiobolus coronatus NRRL 28638]|eukprot:KXN66043.1 hypothetical protein CONCODRAFT_12192 [Conidiobolus coronatus NRRL 28638]